MPDWWRCLNYRPVLAEMVLTKSVQGWSQSSVFSLVFCANFSNKNHTSSTLLLGSTFSKMDRISRIIVLLHPNIWSEIYKKYRKKSLHEHTSSIYRFEQHFFEIWLNVPMQRLNYLNKTSNQVFRHLPTIINFLCTALCTLFHMHQQLSTDIWWCLINFQNWQAWIQEILRAK